MAEVTPTVKQPRKRRIAPQPPPTKPSPKPRKLRVEKLPGDDHCAFIEQLFAATNETTTASVATIATTAENEEKIITTLTVVAGKLSLEKKYTKTHANFDANDSAAALPLADE